LLLQSIYKLIIIIIIIIYLYIYRHIFTIEKSSPTTIILQQQCSRERCSSMMFGNKCSNDECPAALASIFHQQQQCNLILKIKIYF
jgi:hypothetical protein